MIKKILKLENVGSYQSNPIQNSEAWNGEFQKNTIVFGENGVGKTTLSILLNSLKENNNLLKEKKSIGSNGDQEVTILLKDNTKCTYKHDIWDKHCPNIEVFDIHFIEDNVYIGSSLLNSTKNNLFGIIAGEK